jgi:hypothetical protein
MCALLDDHPDVELVQVLPTPQLLTSELLNELGEL